MTRDEDEKSPRLFDSRTIERNIRKGLITRKDYDKYLKALPDVSDKVAPADAPRAISSVGGLDDDDQDDLDKMDVEDDTEEVTVGTAIGAQPEAAADDDTVADDDEADLDDDEDDDDLDDDTAGDETPKA